MKILASDFDNTLYINEEEIFKKNLAAIKKFIQEGNLFCIITGRSYTNIKKVLNEYQISYSYLICEDGAKIFDNVDYCIDTTMLPKEEIEKVQEIFKNNNSECLLEDGYNITNNVNDCVKVLAKYNDKNLANKIVLELQEKTNTYSYVSREHINIISNNINKEKALKKLSEIENIYHNNIYVIGDDINDYEMLKAFNGAIMKKHHQRLDELSKKEYENLFEYVEELINY